MSYSGGFRVWLLSAIVVVLGCSSSTTVIEEGVNDDGGRDVAVAVDAHRSEAAPDVIARADAEEHESSATKADAACVPKTERESCYSKNCGYASDGCGGGFGCGGPDGGAGNCIAYQTCGLLTPNFCDGCVAVWEDGGAGPCGGGISYKCPIITDDAGTHMYLPDGCGIVGALACCH